MSIPLLGLIVLPLAFVVLLTGRGATPWLLGLGVALPFGAVFIAGQNGVTVFQLAAVVIVVSAALSGSASAGAGPETGRRALIGLLIWSAVVTIAAPVIFSGTPVLSFRALSELQFLKPDELAPSATNLSQLAYLTVAVVVVFATARVGRCNPWILGVGLGVVTVLSAAHWAHIRYGLPWADGFVDNLPGVRYIDTVPNGAVLRSRGVYSEPSGLAAGSIATLAFFLVAIGQTRGPKRLLALGVIALAAWNLYLSASATALIGGMLVAVAAVAFGAKLFILDRAKLHPAVLGLALVAIGWLAWNAATIFNAVNHAVSAKSLTTSFESRTGADKFGLQAMFETAGFGVGLGSSRTFSLWANLLTSVGIVGAVLFGVIVWRMARAGWATPRLRPVVAALGATVVAKSLAGPELSDPLLWTSLAIVASHVWRRAEPQRPATGGEGDEPVVADRPRSWQEASTFTSA